METISVTKEFEGSVADLVAYTRTLDSRSNWPGSQTIGGGPDMLVYQLGMRLKGVGTMTDLDIEERLGPVETVGNTTTYAVKQRLTWPYGHEDAEGEYTFVAGHPSTVGFTYRYAPPNKKLIKPKELPGFHQGLEHVIGVYLERLTRSVAAV